MSTESGKPMTRDPRLTTAEQRKEWSTYRYDVAARLLDDIEVRIEQVAKLRASMLELRSLYWVENVSSNERMCALCGLYEKNVVGDRHAGCRIDKLDQVLAEIAEARE